MCQRKSIHHDLSPYTCACAYVHHQLSRWGNCEGTGGGAGISDRFYPNNPNDGIVLPELWCVGDCAGGSTGSSYDDSFDYRLQLMNEYGGRFAANGYKSSIAGFNWQVGDQNVCYLATDIFYQESGSANLPF